MTTTVAFLAALIGALAVEASSPPRPISRRPADLAIRMAAYAAIAVFWFMFSWRPWLASASCIATILTTTTINRLKLKVIGESLVFSDIALLSQVPRHPELYYALPLTDARSVVLILSSIALVVFWFASEPTILPREGIAALVAVLALPLGFVAACLGTRFPIVRDWLAARFPAPDLERDVARYGILAAMFVYGLRRDTERRMRRPVPEERVPPRRPAAEIFVVVQLESFVDPARLGGPDLRLMTRIRQGSAQYGQLTVSAHGAYTMRSEHAVLTGRDRDELGFGRFDPYLAFGGREPTSLARLAKAAGYATTFLHPYHRDFFNRAGVMRELGFERLLMQEDFASAPRIGPYVCDGAFIERVVREMNERTGPVFLFGVTMENHGPWKQGRLPGIDDPFAQYCHHVDNTGRAVERLIDALAGTNAVLCVFGDHPPSLPAHRPGATVPRTNYAVFRFGPDKSPAPIRADLEAFELGRVLRDALTGEPSLATEHRAAMPRS